MTDHSAPSQDDRVEAAPAAPRPAPPPAQPAQTAQTAQASEGGETGDVLIDAALRGLDEAPPEDLDAQIEAGRRVHQTLQARLSDLGGE